jgi:hypothetical protein
MKRPKKDYSHFLIIDDDRGIAKVLVNANIPVAP